MWRPDEQTGNGYYLAYIMNIHIDMYIYIYIGGCQNT